MPSAEPFALDFTTSVCCLNDGGALNQYLVGKEGAIAVTFDASAGVHGGLFASGKEVRQRMGEAVAIVLSQPT